MKKYTLIPGVIVTLLFTLNLQHVCAQDKNIDSLLQQLETVTGDIDKLKLLLNIGYKYQNTNPKKGFDYSLHALRIAENINNRRGIAYANIILGFLESSISNHNTALERHQKALKIYQELGLKEKIPSCYGNIGSEYYYLGRNDKALEYQLKSLNMNKELGIKSGIAACLGNIANIKYIEGKYEEAIEYYKQALKIREVLGNRNEISHNLHNTGVIKLVQGKYSDANTYFHQALEMYKELGNKRGGC